MTALPLAWNMPGLPDWIAIAVVALLLFGKRLPEVGRSLGKGITEFKKGLHGIEDEININDPGSIKPVNPISAPVQQARMTTEAPAALPPEYKFDPYTGKPLEQSKQTTGA